MNLLKVTTAKNVWLDTIAWQNGWVFVYKPSGCRFESSSSHIEFFNHGFEFQDYICNGCHDLTMLSVNISNIAIIS